jgi:HEAT repeat protein
MPTNLVVLVSRGRLTGCAVLFCVALAVAGCRGKSPYEGKSAAELEAMLRSDDPAVQAQGAYGLSRLGPEARPAVHALIAALKEKTTLVRERAALALGQIGPDARAAVPALAEVLRDPDHLVRKAAQEALPKLRK